MDVCKIVILILLSTLTDSKSIIKSPANATRSLGGGAMFECGVQFSVSEAMTWEFNNKIIYSYLSGMDNYPMGSEKYTVINDGKTFSLEINNLVFDDAGEYTCLVMTSSATAILIVLGEPNIITPIPSPVENDTAVYKCEAQFGGPRRGAIVSSHFPKLRIYLEGNNVGTPSETRYQKQGNAYSLVKEYDLAVDPSINDRQLTCEIETVNPARKQVSSIVVTVRFSVRNVTYTPIQDKYEVGNMITCLAHGNPPPFFDWQNLASPGHPIKGNLLHITKAMIGKNTWICTARNAIEDQIHVDSITVDFIAVLDINHPGDPQAKNNGVPAYGVFIILLTVLGLVALGIFVAYKKSLACFKNHQRKVASVENGLGVNEMMLQDTHGEDREARYLNFQQIIKDIQKREDLNEQGPVILDFLRDEGQMIMEHDPDIFFRMITMAHRMIESIHYQAIIEKMSRIYENASNMPESGPLHCLLQVLAEKENPVLLFLNQQKLHSLIQTLVPADKSISSKTSLLNELVIRSEYISTSKYTFKWMPELISTLKLLLENGADPICLMDDCSEINRETRYTTQYQFFKVISRLLLYKSNCFGPIKAVLPAFMIHKTAKDLQIRGTPLHALLEIDLKLINKQHGNTLGTFFQQYKKILEEVINEFNGNGDFLDETDWRCRTPLQLFLEKIAIHENIWTEVADIVGLLKSKNYMVNVDEKGYSVLHFLANAIPIGEISKKGQDVFHKFLKDFIDTSTVAIQDESGQTPLHILAHKCKDITQQDKDIWLHIVKLFATKSNIPIKDQKGCTAMHIIAQNYSKDIQQHCFELFTDLFKHFTSQSIDIKDIQDNQGRTILHILANKFPEEIPVEEVQRFWYIMWYIGYRSNKETADYEGHTALDILEGKRNEDMSPQHQEVHTNLVKFFKTASDNQDEGNTSSPNVSEKPGEKLWRLDECISIPKRQEYIRAYQKDLRHYMMLDEEFIDDLKKGKAMTAAEQDLIKGGPGKSEDEQMQDLIGIMFTTEDNEKYLNFLEVLVEQYEELVNLLTGGKWNISPKTGKPD